MSELSYESFHKVLELQREILKIVVLESGTKISEEGYEEEYEFQISDFMSNIVSLSSCFILEACQRASEGNEELLEELLDVSFSSMSDAVEKMKASLSMSVH